MVVKMYVVDWLQMYNYLFVWKLISEVHTKPRRSGRNKKQTQFFGNPLLYRVTCHLTPRFVRELLQHLSDTMETLQNKYSGTVEF